ncbi:MAG: hypothetical protein WC777_05000 [Candidatus Gracilibacteria bacterium]|jgi:hypothetical protein
MAHFSPQFMLLSACVFLGACATPDLEVNGGTSSLEGQPVVEEVSSVEEPPSATEPFLARIVFAGDLANGEGCADHGADDKCDLFEAEIDLDSGEVFSVRQITDTPVSESYPALAPNGAMAYYSIFKTAREKDMGFVDLESGETGVLLAGATWPEVSPDGDVLLYVANQTKKIMQATLSADGRSLSGAAELTGVANQQDPDFSSDGSLVVFHDTSAGEGEGAVYNMETEETVFYESRSGHCTFGALSFLTVCDNVSAGGLLSRLYEDGLFGDMELFVADQKPSVLKDTDPALGDCRGTSFNYPSFCGDDEHLLVSTSCNQGGSVSFSRLFIIDLTEEDPQYYPLGMNLEEAYAGPGQSSWTVACMAE